MPVFLDLDNTLVDRDGAFSAWARQAVPAFGGTASDIDWLLEADDGGYTARFDLARMLIERLQPRRPDADADADALVSSMRAGIVEHLVCYPGVLDRLDKLTCLGQSLVVVTNGESQQQRMKLARTGLDEVISGVAISGELGFKKPDPRIFDAAYSVSNGEGFAWMVGDHPAADIAGARALGWATAWVSHGRVWGERWVPSAMAKEPADVLALVHQSIVAASGAH